MNDRFRYFFLGGASVDGTKRDFRLGFSETNSIGHIFICFSYLFYSFVFYCVFCFTFYLIHFFFRSPSFYCFSRMMYGTHPLLVPSIVSCFGGTSTQRTRSNVCITLVSHVAACCYLLPGSCTKPHKKHCS